MTTSRRRRGQQALPGILTAADAAWEAVMLAGHRARWFSPAASVALMLHMRRSGLSAEDRDHALLELAIMGPHGSHDLSDRQISRLVGIRGRHHLNRRRQRLRAAGIIASERRVGRSSITRLGPIAHLVASAADDARRTGGVPAAGTPPVPAAGTPPVPAAGTPPVPAAGTPLERRENQRGGRALPPTCIACGEPVDLDADGRPWPRCRTCAFGAPREPDLEAELDRLYGPAVTG